MLLRRVLILVVCEPMTKAAGGFDASWRRTTKAFRHPYRRMLRAARLDLPNGDGGSSDWVRISGFDETRSFIYARHLDRTARRQAGEAHARRPGECGPRRPVIEPERPDRCLEVTTPFH
jgi:hypothetical protein